MDWSVVILAALAMWTVAALNRGLLAWVDPIERVLASAFATAGLFASIGAHELVRIRVSSRHHVTVRHVTVFAVGAAPDPEVERSPASRRAEVVAAIVAPLASFAIALVIAASVGVASAPLPRAIGVWGESFYRIDDVQRLGAPGVVLLEVAAMSFLVGLVSLLPAYPLDGGKLLRALIWKQTGDVERATRLAALTSQVIGWALVVVGAGTVVLASGPSRALTSGVGAWAAFLGWFITSSAAQSYVRLRSA